ncbi:MAG: hypothetical protein HXX12_12185 [Geothrix sp.]|uniref:Ig-like domain-containing protein n=1 Tax=Geothrix sp. TaxID=1962974 RepID=UPI001796D727|nr:Ig-like domain-containing protein [Geothrix sp.]NWJ41715.1 hypothetical protein [Geothrix sp.]WIL20305.1 MAG: Ig-like domain-containing protein [Geothrix sp.]
MTRRRLRGFLVPLALLAAPLILLTSCGGKATHPAPVQTYNPAPAVVIGGTSGTAAKGPVTFMFTFSQPVSSFPASAVTVTSGTGAASTTKVSANQYTLVVTPPANSVGTLTVSVAAGAFHSAAGVANTSGASVTQAFDTRPVVLTQMSLPVTFDSATVNYGLLGFGGADDSSIVLDPAGGTNQVAKVVKSATAETWAGTTLTADGTLGFAAKIPFDAANTRMTVRVYSPNAGIPVRLKVEDHTTPATSVETEAVTTVSNTWETLTFDFAHQATGTTALNVASSYDKATIFFNFGVSGATAGAKTYYFDDVAFIGGTGGGGGATGFSAITFDDAALTYTLTGFGGAEDSTVVTDPAGGSNKVGKVNRSATAETWAGTTVSTGANQSVGKIPLDATHTRMSLRVYAPATGLKVRLKVEDAANNTITCETEATTTVANAWETLTFDFSSPATGTAALDVSKTYDKVSVFFNFGTAGATAGAQTFYFDDVAMSAGGSAVGFSTLTFDDSALTYTLTGFGGAEDSTVVVDPTGGTNKVVKVNRSATAETWAGTTISTGANQSVGKFPFDAANTRMTARVYVPAIGIKVRLKVEDAANNTITCETEATTTVANAWETLTFDFASPATGTAALDVSKTFNKVSVFFNFGTAGATAGAQTFYLDDLAFIGGTGSGGGGALAFSTLTFETGATTYTLTGFGGAEDSTLAADPSGAANQVAKVVKSATAETWAGTTLSTGANQSVGKLPFDAANTRMTVRTYSPVVGIKIRLKVEDASNNTITCETEATTTVANAWETLTFDFASPATGTAALDVTKTYNKVSIFFDFGTAGVTVGSARTYYCDDVTFIGGTGSGGAGGASYSPITFDDAALTYTLTGFGGAEDSTVVTDPAGGSNKVAKVVKSATAELWAGTTVSTGANNSIPTLPFSATRKQISARVWSPDAGIQVRVKVEDAADVTHTCETEATVTTAAGWQTLTFNFANQATGTAALNLAFTYNKLSIFFNFGTTGAAAGAAKTYYLDDITFLP